MLYFYAIIYLTPRWWAAIKGKFHGESKAIRDESRFFSCTRSSSLLLPPTLLPVLAFKFSRWSGCRIPKPRQRYSLWHFSVVGNHRVKSAPFFTEMSPFGGDLKGKKLSSLSSEGIARNSNPTGLVVGCYYSGVLCVCMCFSTCLIFL